MSSARRPLPTDLVALVSFDGDVYPNEAKPLEQLGLDHKAHALETALEQWFSFATGKHTWVSVRGATIRGLLSARSRAKRSVWEVEALIDADEDKGIALSLFSRMVGEVTKQRAERIFVRLDADSHLQETARAAGFFPYAKEVLYQRNGHENGEEGPDLPLRTRVKGDLFGIYQLYNHCVPANVRAIEGATFREWQAAQESWGSKTTDLLLEEDGIINAWLRLANGHVGRFSLLAGTSSVSIDDLIKVALARLSQSSRILTLIREENAGLAAAAERNGFEAVASYVLMAKRLVKPTEELSPEAASTAVPVS